MKIIVPSLGRAGTASSMRWLEQSGREVIFAVHKDEVDAYLKAYGCPVIELPDSSRHHTGLVRQEIMKVRTEPFFFVDDDIRITFKSARTVKDIFDSLEKHMQAGASMAGLGQQLFCNAQMEKCELVNGDPWAIRNKFVATVYGINPNHFLTCPLDVLPVYEDIALVIHSIQSGGGTIVSYVGTHSNVSPPSGGCNSWRTKEITLDCLNKLVELYPDVCSIRPTENTTHSQYIGVGLRVAWSKIRKLS